MPQGRWSHRPPGSSRIGPRAARPSHGGPPHRESPLSRGPWVLLLSQTHTEGTLHLLSTPCRAPRYSCPHPLPLSASSPVPASPARSPLPPHPSGRDRPGRVEVAHRSFPLGTLPFPPRWPQGSPSPSPHPSGDCRAAACAAPPQLLLRSRWELPPHHPSKPGIHHPLPMGV